MSTRFDDLVDKTYHALLGVVQTTAVSKRVLARPPFTFLHKLLVETLEPYGIFTAQQLEYAELASKEDKAAFLTRAFAFVAYAMVNLNEKSISPLLLVSPVKVLAGVAVEDTHEFLQQLAIVCKSSNLNAKEAAAREVLTKGDAKLYTAGVTFRRGLVLIQAIIRAFISRRVGKRKALEASAARAGMGAGAGGSGAPHGPLTMAVGTKFLKELSNGRLYDGVIAAVVGKRYKLRYEQDPGAEDDVDEIEMKILLEESIRLCGLRDRIHGSRHGAVDDDAELLLTSLPNLAPDGKRGLPKRSSSSRGFALSTPPLSRRPSSTGFTPLERSEHQATNVGVTSGGRPMSSTRKDKLEPVLARMISDEESTGELEDDRSPRTELSGEDVDDVPVHVSDEKPWQASLKEILARGYTNTQPAHVGKRLMSQAAIKSVPSVAMSQLGRRSTTSLASSNNAYMPSFPELMIPGMTQKKMTNLPAMQKRKQPTAGFTGQSSDAVKPPSKVKQGRDEIEVGRSKPSESHHHGSNAAAVAPASRTALTSMNATDTSIDTAFGGTYQSIDHKAQEKLALFREIVQRIDGYMKRKHLRVIDLFRFCDADGNGSISPQEMIDTLSQMEIQLSIEQGHDFINYIDKDGNGSIDIDEFEELVRVARRNEAQREQLKKELHHSKKTMDGSKSGSTNRYAVFVKNRQRILDELKQLDLGDVGAVNAVQAKSTVLRMHLVGMDDAIVTEVLERASGKGSGNGNANGGGTSGGQADPLLLGESSTISLLQLVKTLNELDWAKKTNRFLDQSWLAQFDSQLERAYRDFELL